METLSFDRESLGRGLGQESEGIPSLTGLVEINPTNCFSTLKKSWAVTLLDNYNILFSCTFCATLSRAEATICAAISTECCMGIAITLIEYRVY